MRLISISLGPIPRPLGRTLAEGQQLGGRSSYPVACRGVLDLWNLTWFATANFVSVHHLPLGDKSGSEAGYSSIMVKRGFRGALRHACVTVLPGKALFLPGARGTALACTPGPEILP